jgi:hypothetical protein
MVVEPSRVKQLFLNHGSKIGLTLSMHQVKTRRQRRLGVAGKYILKITENSAISNFNKSWTKIFSIQNTSSKMKFTQK